MYIHIHIHIYQYIRVDTSSAAQGGGGSFKQKEAIGKVSACDAWMAERNPLMDRKVVAAVLFGVVAAVTSTTTAGCSVV